jgi:hypothetical protein
MSYRYTCPLCLKKLGRGDALKVFKLADATSSANNGKPSKKRVVCGDEDFVEQMIQFGGDYAFMTGGERAVYVSHERCPAANPFWDGTKQEIEIPGNQDEGERLGIELECEITGNSLKRSVSHRVVSMLREAFDTLGNDYSPMWYPLPLLLATAAEEGDGGRRPFGSLVEMASTKAAGKTILSLQILNQALYRNGRGLSIEDFFYPNPDKKDADLTDFKKKFFKELFYHSMWKRTPFSRPAGTTPSPGDLRAIFIEPVPDDGEAGSVALDLPRGPGNVRRTVGFLAGLTWNFIVETARPFKGATVKTAQPKKKKGEPQTLSLDEIFRQRAHEFWNPILFYDTAGELHAMMSPITRAVRQLSNKLAIYIDAREIFDKYDALAPGEQPTPIDERNASIRHAFKRIRELSETPRKHRRPTCIVVTKLDLVLSDEEREEVKRLTEQGEAGDRVREMLARWLSEHSDDDKSDLLSLLSKERGLVDRVFFVWTENLPKMMGIRYSPINKVVPPSAFCGEEVTIEANVGFDFREAKRVTFNGLDSQFQIVSETQIKARVPDGATSGFIGILLEATASGPAQQSTSEIDDATSDFVFEVKPGKGNDAAKPRSYGLINFLAWCLDKKVEEISRPTPGH